MLKNILRSLFTKGLVALINFLLLIISARYLGVSSRGEISILIINITIIQIINEVYTGYSLIYFIPKYDLKRILFTGILYTFIACSLGNSVFYFLKKQLNGYEWFSFFISLIVILNTFNCVIILGKQKISLYNLLSMLQPALLMIGLIVSIFVLHEYTVKAYIWPMMISFIISFIISMTAVIRIVPVQRGNEHYRHKSIFVYGFMSQITSLMYVLCNRYSYYLLPDSADVGLYASSSSLIESVLIISNGISPVLLAWVANAGNSEKSREITQSLSKVSLIFSTIAILIITALPESFFIFLLGKGFTGTKHLMLLYAPGVLMVSFFGMISNYFSALGKFRINLICNSLGFALTLTLAPFMIKKFGIDGAAYTADISYFIIATAIYFAFFFTNQISFSRFFSLRKDYRNLLELITSKQ